MLLDDPADHRFECVLDYRKHGRQQLDKSRMAAAGSVGARLPMEYLAIAKPQRQMMED